MPIFKPKSMKRLRIYRKYSNTLDNKHKEFINNFMFDENEILPKLRDEKKKMLYKKINAEKRKKNNIDELLNINDKLKEIDYEIDKIKNRRINYYLNNSKYIFGYFENKKYIHENKTNQNSKNQSLYKFFKIDNKEEDNIEKDINNDNKNLVNKYFYNIDESFVDMNMYVKQTDICTNCNNGELIPLDDEGILICNNCAINIPYLIENEKNSYKDPPKEVCFYAYKKINHFKEILSQFQGKETTQIPNYVIDKIKSQIEKERINLNELNYYTTKEILKKLGFNKYYEHIAFIKNKLGIKPPIFSSELENSLCNLFLEIQNPYSKVCPENRVNFLNYYYVLFKLCELLGEYTYLNEIPQLKDREKLMEQDDIWKKICIELNWKFNPTI